MQEDTAIVDLHAQDGDNILPFITACDESQSFVLLNASVEAHRRYAEDKRVEILDTDLMTCYPQYKASVTLSLFGFCNLPIPAKYMLAEKAYKQTEIGGALIIVDKIHSPSSSVNSAMQQAFLSIPNAASVITQVDPITAKQTEIFLACAGFREIDCFYRSLDVAGFIAIKGA
jgi:hypothetical protein